jgi:two-component system sensor histidine kinase TtrS
VAVSGFVLVIMSVLRSSRFFLGRLFPGLLFLAALSWSTFAHGADVREIRVGVLAYRGADRATDSWTGTFTHLNRALPQWHFTMAAGDLAFLDTEAAAGRLDFIITNPGHYVELETAYGASRIATVESIGGPPPAAAVAATVFIRADQAGIKDIADLRGRTLAAVSPETFGFRQAWREMSEQGVDPFADSSKLRFVGFPADNVVEAVRRGDADAGIVRACLIESMAAEGRVQTGEFRVLAAQSLPTPGCQISTRLYPDWPFAKLAGTSDALAKQVAQALLSMPAGADGQSWTVPVDYHSVHDLYRILKLGPYQALARRGLSDLLWQYRHWLALFGLGFLWWVIHVLRVQVLVRRRTEELRAANETARQHREELDHAGRLSLVGEMASGLAHEINQPLAAIANYAKGCLRRLESRGEPEQIVHGLQQIAAQAERGGDIVRRMRDFVRKRPVDIKLVRMEQVIEEAIMLFTPVARRKQVELRLTPCPHLPAVQADPVQMEEVVLNLLQNAVDAVESSDRRQIELSAAAGPAGLTLSVCDSGPGISPASIDHLFEPFFTTKPQGLGLGLSLCRSIVESHGGRLWTENRAEGGAVFHVFLPAAKEPFR